MGGNRRIDRILADDFAEDLGALPLEELKQRRDECLAEREYLSLLRRLVQGRFDILQAEVKRRRTGEDEALLERLPTILADRARGVARGEVLRVGTGEEEEVAQARRRVERLVADAAISDPGGLADEELDRAVGALKGEERLVSETRNAVIAVHELLQEELKRRFREDFSPVANS